MLGREYVGNGGEEMRYGYNGKEVDKYIDSQSSTYDYGFRIYNATLGKFLSVDPLTSSYPHYTPYQFAGNQPIWAIDKDGLEEHVVIQWYNNNKIVRISISTYKDSNGDLINQRLKNTKGDLVAGDEKIIVYHMNLDGTIRAAPTLQAEFTNEQSNVYESEAVLNVKADGTHPTGFGSEGPKIKQGSRIVQDILTDNSLVVESVSNSSDVANQTKAKESLKPLAQYMLSLKNSKVILTGNSGNDEGSSDPTGTGSDVWNFKIKIDGSNSTIGELQINRAKAVSDILSKDFKIDESRITIKKGTNYSTPKGRNVSIQLNNN
jgi:RHS repeat-associated protein